MERIGGTGNAPYSVATKVGNMVFISGQISERDSNGKKLGVEEQTRNIMRSIEAILCECGGSISNLVKCNVYLAHREDFDRMNQAYRDYLGDDLPARLCIYDVSLYDDVDVEIDGIAVIE